MLLHQSLLNNIEQSLTYWSEDVNGTSFDCRLEIDGDQDRNDIVLFLPQWIIAESLDLYRTIRSVISSNGTDKTLSGHLKVIIETFLSFLSSSLSPKAPDQHLQLPDCFVSRTSSFGFLLWLLCLPPSTCPTSIDGVSLEVFSSYSHFRSSQSSQIATNPMLYGSLLQCADFCFQFPSAESAPDSSIPINRNQFAQSNPLIEMNDETQNKPVFNGLLFLLQALRCSHCCSSTNQLPRRVCQQFLARCLSHEDRLVRKSAGQILLYCISNYSTTECLPINGNQSTFLESISLVFSRELSTILKTIIGDQNRQKSKGSKYFNDESSTAGLTRFLEFISDVLPYLPAQFQTSILINDLLVQLSGNSFPGLLRHPKIPVLGFRTISRYFQRFCSSSNCLSDESWDIHRRVINSLINHKSNTFNAIRVREQIKAIFDGLLNLVQYVDDFSEVQITSTVRIGRRSDISDLTYTMIESPNSFFRSAMVETDPTIQEGFVEGWTKLFNASTTIRNSTEDKTTKDFHGGILLYSVIAETFLSLLSFKFKPIWRNLFTIFISMFDSIQQIALPLYHSLGTTSSQVILSAFIASLGKLGDKTPSEIQSLLDNLTATLRSAKANGFGQFYRSFSQALFRSVFEKLLSRLSFILHQVEEPSSEALSILDHTVTAQLSAGQLKSAEAAIHRTELRRCVGYAFRVFGCRSMLSFSSLSLDQLASLPLVSPRFAYDSNSWVLPLMAEFVARDELQFFESHFLPLARTLSKKSQTIGNGELGFIEARHYRRLVRLRF